MNDPAPLPLPAPYDALPPAPRRSRILLAGETLFRQGDPALGAWFLHAGELVLERLEPSGRRLALHRARAGDVVAEASLFAERYHCDAVARGVAEVTLLARDALLARFADDPVFARALAESFAREVRRLRRRVELLAIPAAETRVLEAARDGLLAGADVRGFAESIALTPEATSRALAALVRRGLLVRESRGRYALAADATGSRAT